MTTSGEATHTLRWAGDILVQAGTPDGFSVALRHQTTVTPRHCLLVTELQNGVTTEECMAQIDAVQARCLGPQNKENE